MRGLVSERHPTPSWGGARPGPGFTLMRMRIRIVRGNGHSIAKPDGPQWLAVAASLVQVGRSFLSGYAASAPLSTLSSVPVG
jgi:hypothetical protein